LRARPYEEILSALLSLGCRVAREDEWFIWLVRGAAIIQALPKTATVPADIQRRILTKFSFTEPEFLDALARRA